MSISIEDKILLEKLQLIARDPEKREQLAETIAGNGPTYKGAPYFREKFALEVKAILDLMLGDGMDRILRYSDFPDIAKSSLHMRLTQGWAYLIHRMDDDKGTFKSLREQVVIRKKNEGILLTFDLTKRGRGRQSTVDMDPSKATAVDRELAKPATWKSKLDEFLENSTPGSKLLLSKLSLTDEEVAELEVNLAGLGLYFKITSKEIRVVKPLPETTEEDNNDA